MTIYKFAGFWRRLGAYMLDYSIIFLIFFVLAMIASLAFFSGAVSVDNKEFLADLANPDHFSPALILIWSCFVILFIGYFTYFHGTTGKTPGKMLFGLQVVSADGSPISFGVAFLRTVGYFISNIFYLGYIWVAFDKRKQGWHDKIAGTVVIIRESQNGAAGISIPDQPADLPTKPEEVKTGETSKEQGTQTVKPPENNDN